MPNNLTPEEVADVCGLIEEHIGNITGLDIGEEEARNAIMTYREYESFRRLLKVYVNIR